jgi:uncharacterized protein with von Willebrand factor type A (vWA) domain
LESDRSVNGGKPPAIDANSTVPRIPKHSRQDNIYPSGTRFSAITFAAIDLLHRFDDDIKVVIFDASLMP